MNAIARTTTVSVENEVKRKSSFRSKSSERRKKKRVRFTDTAGADAESTPLWSRLAFFLRTLWQNTRSSVKTVFNSELEELGEQLPRYRPDSIAALRRVTRFTEPELKRLYRGFKAECPTGVVKEDTFKLIYSQFFPQGVNEDSVESRIETRSRNRSCAGREQRLMSLRPRSIHPPNASLESSINNSTATTNEKNRDETYMPSTDDEDENSSLSNCNTNINDTLSSTRDNAHIISNVSLPTPTSVTETPQHTLLADSLATCSPPLLDVAINVTVGDGDVNDFLPSTLRQQIISPDAFCSPSNILASDTDTSFIEDSGVMKSSHASNVCILPSDDSNLTVKDQIRPCSLNSLPNRFDSSGIENSQILQSCVPATYNVCVPTGDSEKSNLIMDDNQGSNKLYELTTVPIEEEKIPRRSPTFTSPPIISNSSPTRNENMIPLPLEHLKSRSLSPGLHCTTENADSKSSIGSASELNAKL